MIYFKLPFNDTLYSTDEKNDQNPIQFYSFDGIEEVCFHGNIIEISSEDFNDKKISSDLLSKDMALPEAETKEEYLQQLEKVIRVIQENHLPKLVYARRKIFTDFTTLDLKASFNNLCQSYGNAFRYIFIDGDHSWMGAFSEVLGKFNKKTHEFETMSLAGTLPVLEEWSEKEIEEQKPVSTYIRSIVKNYSDYIEESETYDHISGNIKHLRTDFKIKINPEDLGNIINDLHPTPAVCGIPKDFCKENIQKFEKFARELYSGYIRIENEETIQYFVNLRCSKLYQNAVHSFVGGGITAQSLPEKEWRETELKSEAVLKNLEFI